MTGKYVKVKRLSGRGVKEKEKYVYSESFLFDKRGDDYIVTNERRQ